MNEDQKSLLKELIRKVDVLTRIAAISVVSEKEFGEQVKLLGSAGLPPKDIAVVLGKSQNHVNVTLHRLRSKKK